jgi:four helix bundle protein
MPTFKDLWIWKESQQLMIEIHCIPKLLPSEEKFRKKDQIERSSSAVPDNISEGYAAYYYNDKIKSLYIARKEAAETQNHLEALVGKEYLERKKADILINRYEKVMAGINSFINYIRDKRLHQPGRGKYP